jgi:hypothetical protein
MLTVHGGMPNGCKWGARGENFPPNVIRHAGTEHFLQLVV